MEDSCYDTLVFDRQNQQKVDPPSTLVPPPPSAPVPTPPSGPLTTPPGLHGEYEAYVQSMVEAASRKAEAEGVKQALVNLKVWTNQTAEATKRSVELPLNEVSLNQVRSDTQVLLGEIENHLALTDELERKAVEMQDQEAVQELGECKEKLKRSNSDLMGLRDNIFDAINGLQAVKIDVEKLSRSVDAVASRIRSASGRDAGKLREAEEDVVELQKHAELHKSNTRRLCEMPNVVKTEPVRERTQDLLNRVDLCAEELNAKRGTLAEMKNLDSVFEGVKKNLNSWLSKFDDDLKGLDKVSVDQERLGQQRTETLALAAAHVEGHSMLDELEALAQQLTGVEDAQAAVKGANASRQVTEANGRLQRQASELKQRGDRINKMDVKATAFAESEAGVLECLKSRKAQLDKMPTPFTKEEVKSQLLDLEQMDKSGRGEQRRVEEARLSARELAREASVEKEAEDMNKREKRLADNWDEIADKFDAAKKRAQTAEKVLEEVAKMEKWIGARQKMVDAIGAPSTDAATAKTQGSQIQLMKAETDSEKVALDDVNDLANKLMATAGGKDSVEELMKKMDALNRRWHSLESGLDEKASRIEETTKLGDDLQHFYKELENQLGELKSNVEKASAMSPNDIGAQLATLDSLKSRFGGVDEAIEKLKGYLLDVQARPKPDDLELLEMTMARRLVDGDTANELMRRPGPEANSAADRVASESQRAAGKINSLVAEIANLDPVGRSRDELQRQKSEVVELKDQLKTAQTKLLDLDEKWDAALNAGIVEQSAFEANHATFAALIELSAQSGKLLAQRDKKLAETEDEIAKLHADADDIANALREIAGTEVLTPSSPSAVHQQQDPKVVADKVRLLKDQLKPVGEKMDAFNSECKLMIETAGPKADTRELDELLKRVGDAWSDVAGKVSDREMTVDAAVQQQERPSGLRKPRARLNFNKKK